MKPVIFRVLLIFFFACTNCFAANKGKELKNPVFVFNNAFFKNGKSVMPYDQQAVLLKKLGFDGKSIINPRQIEPLHKVFMPSEKDLNKARAIMDAIAEANARGSGVASLKGKMIDKPVVIRAQRLLDLYEAGRRIDEVED